MQSLNLEEQSKFVVVVVFVVVFVEDPKLIPIQTALGLQIHLTLI